MQIDDVRAFAWVVSSGSLSRTAREQNLPKATLSHRLRRLENDVGTALLIRSAAGLTPTKAGWAFLRHAEEVNLAYTRALDSVASEKPAQSVRLSVGATDELSTNLLAPLSLRFATSHPEVSLDLHVMPLGRLLSRETDLDCMICSGLPAILGTANLVARGFSRYVSRLYAAPTYLAERGTPTHPDNLRQHDLISGEGPSGVVPWALENGQASQLIEPRGPLRANDNWVAKVCVLQGYGIGLFPEFFAQEHVPTGDLIEVLPAWTTAPTSVTVLYHDHRFANPHIRAFIDFLVSEFEGFYCFPYRQRDVFRPMPGGSTTRQKGRR